MPKHLILFPDGETRKAKGRNLVNADAIEVFTDPKQRSTYISARVASTGGLQHAWMSLPDDPRLLLDLAEAIKAQAYERWVEYSAFIILEDGSQEYIDSDDPDEVDGYTVYLRVQTPEDPQQDFDLREERDFVNKQGALLYVSDLEKRYRCGVERV